MAGAKARFRGTGVEPTAKEIKVQGDFIRETLGDAGNQNTGRRALACRHGRPRVCQGDEITVSPPSWRFDLQLSVDIVEEVVRTWGYEHIVETAPAGGRNLPSMPSQPFSSEATRRFFAARGFYEIISYSLSRPRGRKILARGAAIRLKNPISEDMSVMRTSLLGGLMNCARFNVSHKQGRIRLFEIGRCFFPDDADDLPKQPQRLAGLVYGPEKPAQWGENTRASDFYDLKGVLEFFLGALRTTVEVLRQPPPYLHPAKAEAFYGKANPWAYLAKRIRVWLWIGIFAARRSFLNWTLSAFIAVKNPPSPPPCRAFPWCRGIWRYWRRKALSPPIYWRRQG